ncbi:hypothetical protein TI03_02565 [Achromatium sp. WMS1]|nr:hypothetical protein TI03_02565 [Achromatium sp. WMS1]
MAIYIRSHWKQKNKQRSLEEIAKALAVTAWRVAKDKAMHLHGEHFMYQDDQQRVAVIVEYLYFQVHILDRLTYQILDDDEREVLIAQFALQLAEYIQDNSTDLFGPGEYTKPFTHKLNQRSNEYGELSFTDAGPSYPMLRHLGYQIQQLMGEKDENRWVIDHVMDNDGGAIYKLITRTLKNLIS